MAIDDTEDAPAPPAMNPAVPQDNTLSPALQNVAGLFQTDEGKDLAGTVLPMIQQHLNLINVADANAAAGQQQVQQVQQTKDNLIGMVRNDPTAADLAVNLAPHLVGALVDGSGIADPDQAASIHADLTQHIQSETARAAVTKMAEINGNAAKQLMGTLTDHLSDDDQSALGKYISTMDTARQMDHAAQINQLTQDRNDLSQTNAFKYATQLMDRNSEQVQLPQDFMANLVANRAIQPADKAPIAGAFKTLMAVGDVPTSNPHVISALLQDIGNPTTPPVSADAIMQHVGSNLRYADAQMLHGMSLGKTPVQQRAAAQLGSILSNAATTLNASGSTPGNAAFGRFTDWLTSSFRQTGIAGLDGASPNYLFKTVGLNSFPPQHEDIVQPAPGAERPSLGQIFAQGNQNTGDLRDKINRVQGLHEENVAPIAPASGSFYQRKVPSEPEPSEEGKLNG